MSTRDTVLHMLARGLSQAEIARTLGVTKSTVSYHARRLHEPDARFRRRYDWQAVQAYYDEGHTVAQCASRFGFSTYSWHAAKQRGVILARPNEMSIDRLLAGSCRDRGHLKRRLLKAGLLVQQCGQCGLIDWRGRPLALELHHLNGDGQDNRLENLQLLCPNCHSQTDTWGGRNKRRTRLPTPAQDAPTVSRDLGPSPQAPARVPFGAK